MQKDFVPALNVNIHIAPSGYAHPFFFFFFDIRYVDIYFQVLVCVYVSFARLLNKFRASSFYFFNACIHKSSER